MQLQPQQNTTVITFAGGEVSGTIDDCLRHAITKLSQFHLVSNDLSKRRLLAMGEEEERILVAGCPSYDSLLTANVGRKGRLHWEKCDIIQLLL